MYLPSYAVHNVTAAVSNFSSVHLHLCIYICICEAGYIESAEEAKEDHCLSFKDKVRHCIKFPHRESIVTKDRIDVTAESKEKCS